MGIRRFTLIAGATVAAYARGGGPRLGGAGREPGNWRERRRHPRGR